MNYECSYVMNAKSYFDNAGTAETWPDHALQSGLGPAAWQAGGWGSEPGALWTLS